MSFADPKVDAGTKVSVSGLYWLPVNDEVLLVKPTYKDGWDLPGGIAEGLESPAEALRREMLEELRVKCDVGNLLCVDFLRQDWEDRPVLLLIFHVEFPGDPVMESLVLQREEIAEAELFPYAYALELVSPHMRRRLQVTRQNLLSERPLFIDRYTSDAAD